MSIQRQIQNQSEQEDSPALTSGVVETQEAMSPTNEVPIALELALIKNLAMLQQHNLASAEDCSQVSLSVRESWENGQGADPIDGIARLRTGAGDMMEATVEMISAQMAKSLPSAPTKVSFAARLIPPNSFYEKYPQIAQLSRLMLAPIAYTEDLDVIGIASINPFFADALASSILEEVKPISPVQPIISIVRLDYAGWLKMCDKHFK